LFIYDDGGNSQISYTDSGQIHAFNFAGRIRVVLNVMDGAGNRNSETVAITPSEPGAATERFSVWSSIVAILVICILCAIILFWRKSRRRAPEKNGEEKTEGTEAEK